MIYLIASLAFADNGISHWTTLPKIFICDDTDVPLENINKALEYWDDFGLTHLEVVNYNCNTDRIQNLKGIVIEKSKDLGRGNGGIVLGKSSVTKINSSGDKSDHIRNSVVILDTSYKDNYYLLVHEIGHAYGIPHIYEEQSIMHPNHVHFSGVIFNPLECEDFRTSYTTGMDH